MADSVAEAGSPLEALVQWVEDAEDAFFDARKFAERDRDYYDNKQLTDAESATLKKRGQPPIVVNRIKRKIDFLLGIETQQRSDPKAYPRNPSEDDQSKAEAATDAIRYVCDLNRWQYLSSDVWRNILVEGLGGVEVTVEARGGRVEVALKPWAWDRLFFDPRSFRHDFSDARYMGGVIWMDEDEARETWPEQAGMISATMSSSGPKGETYEDKPKHWWADSKRQRVRIVQIWYRSGARWRWAKFVKGGILQEGDVPFVNEYGESECPLLLRSAYIDRENNRYGAIRELIPIQDEVNKRRSKLLHLATMRQVIADKGAVDDPRKARQELARPDGYVEVNPNARFEIARNDDIAAGQAALLSEAKSEIDLMGPNASMTGKGQGGQSGRAIMAQQQGGYIELGPLMDGFREWKHRVYRAIWCRIRQYWDDARWVRVRDDEEKMRFVGLNQPGIDEHGRPVTRNKVADIDVDIVVDEGPDTITLQQEQFDGLVKLATAGVPIPPDVLIEASQIRNKRAILEKLKGGDNPEAAAVMAQAKELEMAGRAADIEKTKAQAFQSRAAATKDLADLIVMPTQPQALPMA